MAIKDKEEILTIDNAEALQKTADLAEELKAAETAEEKPATTMVEDTKIVKQTETLIVFHVTKPLMPHEYDELEKRVRLENEKSGLKIVLAPFSVEVEVK